MTKLQVRGFNAKGEVLLGRGITDEGLALERALAEVGFAVWIDAQGFVRVDWGVRA